MANKYLPKQYIVVYRPHGALKSQTYFFGTFYSFTAADDFLCDELPALGIPAPDQEPGVKYVQELMAPREG